MRTDKVIRLVRPVTLFYLVFVVYGSLVPLNFQPVELSVAIERFRQIPFLDLGIGSRADWVANLLLFIPLSYLMAASVWPGRRAHRILVSLFITIVCALLSLSIEFVQIFFPPRTVSQNDILAESLGGMLGVLAFWVWGSRSMAWLASWQEARGPSNLAEKLLGLYLFLFVGYSILPLDLTISLVEIYHKWAEGRLNIIPFAATPTDPAFFVYEIVTDALLWGPVSLLLVLSGRVSRSQAIVWTLAIAALLEFLQVFVWSRVSDVTDLITAVPGAFMGAWLASRLRPQAASKRPSNRFRFSRPWMIVGGILGWCLLLALVFWYPFDFSRDKDLVKRGIDAMFQVPFVAYYFGTELRAITEVFRKVGFFLPLGAMLAWLRWTLGNHGPLGGKDAALLFLLLGPPLVIELGQLPLVDKHVGSTDLFLEWLGGILGYVGLVVLAKRWQAHPGAEPSLAALANEKQASRALSKAHSDLRSKTGRERQQYQRRTNGHQSFGRATTPYNYRPSHATFYQVVFSVVAILSAGYATYMVSPFGLGWVVAIAIPLSLIAVSPFAPLVGVGAFVFLLHGLPRYDPDLANIQELIPLYPIAAILVLVGWALRSKHDNQAVAWHDPAILACTAFVGWLFLCFWIGYFNYHQWTFFEFSRHHPINHLLGYAFFIIAVQQLGSRNATYAVAAVFVCSLLLSGLANPDSISLNGDLGAMTAIAFPLGVLLYVLSERRSSKMIWIAATLGIVTLLLLTKNRGGLVGMIVGVLLALVVAVPKKHLLLAVIASGFLFSSVFLISGFAERLSVLWDPHAAHETAGLDRSTVKERIRLWRCGLELARSEPIWGVGTGNFSELTGQCNPSLQGLIAHNNFVNVVAESGFLGLGLYVTLLALVYYAGFRRDRAADRQQIVTKRLLLVSFSAYLAISFFVSRHDMVFAYLLMGWIVALGARQHRQPQQPDNSYFYEIYRPRV